MPFAGEENTAPCQHSFGEDILPFTSLLAKLVGDTGTGHQVWTSHRRYDIGNPALALRGIFFRAGVALRIRR